MGVTRTDGIPAFPGNNNFKLLHAGAAKFSYKEVHTATRPSTSSRVITVVVACSLVFVFRSANPEKSGQS